MTQAQIQLQNALTTTFLANMVFLNEYDNELYQRVENLSRMIETGEYQERYELEFVMENGDFDIFDTATNSYLYNKNPKEGNQNLLKQVDFSNKNAIVNIEGYFTYKDNKTIDINYNANSEFSSLLQKQTQEYSNALNDFLDKPLKQYQIIEKYIFFGTLLGVHIPKIIQKINPQVILIMEQNLEIFRLSLFTTNYYAVGQDKNIIFSIMEDSFEVEQKFYRFLNQGILDNYLIKYSEVNKQIRANYFPALISILVSLKATKYDYARMLYSYINKTTNCIKEGYNFLLFNKIKESFHIFENLPILYIASGPSLDENIDWIYENQDRFFIVTIGSSFKKLVNKGIKVDLVATLDEQKWLEKRQFPSEIVEKTDDNIVFFASAITNKKILERLEDKNLFIFEVFQAFIKENYGFEGHSIGELTIDILLQLNAKNIYILGLDLAINQNTGETHSLDTSHIKIINEENNEKLEEDSRYKLIKIKGNLQESINSITLFHNSIKELEAKIRNREKDVNIYNLSKHGAYFETTIPTKIEDINIEKFPKLDKKAISFKEQLSKFSQKGLSSDLKNEYKTLVEFLSKDLKKLLQTISKKEYKSYLQLKENLYIIISLCKEKDNLLHLILLNYFQIVIPYLNHHFNDKELIQEYNKVQKIKEIFINQVEVLLDDYILCLKRVL
ncbi:motility associated factor glycosyltransferase family protein [Aliarcobacter skirrowii]|uniref:motility associated factor glycosyltransferase family protein n=1 Tax=Aliarcobacter skirrowii TaxID=28200 RepID=UPI0029BB044D|nr:6-hydroxymethylpterin diphosphokinase MptE-like protein [Aliarcobacter skirrowii]MDX4038466.1 DUF115 domain-containing protein [Aliarcobacter skirrowii]